MTNEEAKAIFNEAKEQAIKLAGNYYVYIGVLKVIIDKHIGGKDK